MSKYGIFYGNNLISIKVDLGSSLFRLWLVEKVADENLIEIFAEAGDWHGRLGRRARSGGCVITWYDFLQICLKFWNFELKTWTYFDVLKKFASRHPKMFWWNQNFPSTLKFDTIFHLDHNRFHTWKTRVEKCAARVLAQLYRTKRTACGIVGGWLWCARTCAIPPGLNSLKCMLPWFPNNCGWICFAHWQDDANLQWQNMRPRSFQ